MLPEAYQGLKPDTAGMDVELPSAQTTLARLPDSPATSCLWDPSEETVHTRTLRILPIGSQEGLGAILAAVCELGGRRRRLEYLRGISAYLPEVEGSCTSASTFPKIMRFLTSLPDRSGYQDRQAWRLASISQCAIGTSSRTRNSALARSQHDALCKAHIGKDVPKVPDKELSQPSH